MVLFDKLIWMIVVLFISLITSLILFGESNITLAFFGIVLPPVLFMLYIAFDTKKYVDSASITISENTVDFHAENLFTRSNNSVPTSQVNNATVNQGFIWKLFGIASVSFLDESGVMTSLWGFNYDDAVVFVKEFGSKYKIKMSR